ncbi:uncharacterized protein [Triticum aestivum]|uniref:uncharacterized protein n=1 Tax=Triticum aestivum TaxID=4565 RepID=UPI001D0093CA|nr:uncharacterized protein LOC123092009 [Triticum aestivum]
MIPNYPQFQRAPSIVSMASSSSTSQRNPPRERLSLIPCLYCHDRMMTFICVPTGSRPGDRFYKCIRKDSGGVREVPDDRSSYGCGPTSDPGWSSSSCSLGGGIAHRRNHSHGDKSAQISIRLAITHL